MQPSAKSRKTGKPAADDRITARIPRANRLLLEKAAAIYGATLNQFIVQSAIDRAGEILHREEALRLSGRDAAAFLDALDNPPAPVDNLVQALNAHSHLVKC